MQVRPDLAYGPLPEERLDLCLPRSAPGERPGVVLLHGGGWASLDKSHFAGVCAFLAAQGFVAATLNYRLAPRSRWPAQLVDAQLAVRWLRSQARQLALDPTRLCSWGDSAGGHLAVFLGVLQAVHRGDQAALLADQPPTVSCVVDEFGPVDLVQWNQTPYQRQTLADLFGGATPESHLALSLDASPLRLVSPQSAAMLILQGTHDTVVAPGQSQALQLALEQQHVFVRYLSFVGEHEYQGISAVERQRIEEQRLAFLLTQAGEK